MRSIRGHPEELSSALYLQVSIISQALIFVTRSRSWSFVERPGILLVAAFIAAQLVRYTNPSNCFCFTRLKYFLSSFHQQMLIEMMLFSVGDNYRRLCELGLCKDPRHWMGLGRSHLAL